MYYGMQHLRTTDNDIQNSFNSKIEKGVPLEAVGKLYSDSINIPILDDSLNNQYKQNFEKSENKKMMICKACSRSLPVDSKFCIYCGSKLF
jgi:rRNA maturation endonuclease Nob1